VTTKILVIGASGMLGNAVMRLFAQSPGYETVGTVRRATAAPQAGRLKVGVDVENIDALIRLLAEERPDVVVNCVGLVKQLSNAEDPLAALPLNAMLPHRLASLCALAGARLVHVSTDCVFAGTRGDYLETDAADASDLYGRSKFIGEVDYPNAVTLRTSIIGHELDGNRSLINWFLSQRGAVKGFSRAIFSGLPTVELARVIRDHVLPHEIRGLWHVSAEPISKLDLLRLVADAYGHDIEIVPEDGFAIDRSLNSDRFRARTGFAPEPWPELVRRMRDFA
jgi:dTDP-4-dehydrorhamnose reductase